MRKAPSLLILIKSSSAGFLLQSPANHSLSSFPDCFVGLIPPKEATGLGSVIGGFGGLAILIVSLTACLGLASFSIAGRGGFRPGVGGGSLVGKVARLSSTGGTVFISFREGSTELDFALGTGGFIMGMEAGIFGDSGILIGPRGAGGQAAVGSK